jgi:hypothetical protein
LPIREPPTRRDILSRALDPPSKKLPQPVALFADGASTSGSAERLEEGAILFTPAPNCVLPVGVLVTADWGLGQTPRRDWDSRRTLESLVVAERFTVAGEERYLLLPRAVCKRPGPSTSVGGNRRKGFRLDLGETPIEAAFQPASGAPVCKGIIGNISFGGAALTIPRAIEKRSTHTIDLDVSLNLSPPRPHTRVRVSIKSRRLVGNDVVWGLSFRLDKSPEPMRAEASIRDYLICHQLAAMRERALQRPRKGLRPVFYIPTSVQHWESTRSANPSRSIGNDVWRLLEVKRTRALAKRLFPEVDFEITEDVPASQTYERGSINLEIKAVLENRTALRLHRKRAR